MDCLAPANGNSQDRTIRQNEKHLNQRRKSYSPEITQAKHSYTVSTFTGDARLRAAIY